MTYWQTPAFKALQQAWYERLEAEGFEDAERDRDLINTTVRDYRFCDFKTAYYQIMTQKLGEAIFRNDIERMVLTSYCEGKKVQTICEELRTLCKPPCFRHPRKSRHTIRFIVRRYEAAWGLREWTPRQLGRKVS